MKLVYASAVVVATDFFKTFFESLVHDSPAPMVLFCGQQFTVEAASATYRDLVPGREVLHRRYREIFPRPNEMADFEILRSVFETGRSQIVREQPWRIQDPTTNIDRERYFDSTYTLIREASHRPYGVFQIALEVTDQVVARRQLAESEERNRLALEGGKMGTWYLRLPEREVVVDEKSHKLHHIKPNEDFNTVIAERIHKDDLPMIENALKEAVDYGALYEVEYRVRTDDGGYVWIYTRGEPIRDKHGKVIQLAGVSYDVTQRKESEIELSEAKSEAEQANRSKSDFLANMSHEIRTPLNAILGFADLVREDDLPLAVKDRYLNSISRNGMALTRIIDDILDLAKVEAGKVAIERVDFSVTELMQEVLEIFAERAESKGIYLRVVIVPAMPGRLLSDPSRLRQILLNVVGNAVKFTVKGGIDIRVEPSSTTAYRILVTDTGIGLSEAQQQKLFAPFVQADTSTTRKFGGTGLGLALSKRLAVALGGNLLIERSTPGVGSVFAVTFSASIPKDYDKKLTVLPERAPADGWPGRNILVVDDSEDNQFLIKNLLERQGMHVETADNGREAFRKSTAEGFDLILMEIQMPVMDGYESTRAIRGVGVKTPIIALTAHAMPEDRARTHAAGFDGHLTKPLVQSALVETLRKWLH